jgi:hypothetical protein
MHRLWSPVAITQLTIDQLTNITDGEMFAKLDGVKTRIEGRVPPSVESVILGPLGGEGFLRTNMMMQKAS